MSELAGRPSRLAVRMQVFVRGVDANGVPFDMEVDSNNVSRGGLAFSCEMPLEAGAALDITVNRPPIGGREFPPHFTTGKVVRVHPKPGGGYDVGVEFTGPRLRIFVG
jgi:hypothetical protein